MLSDLRRFSPRTFWLVSLAAAFVLTAVCAVWMHWTVMDMLHRESPELAGRIEHPSGLPSLIGRRHRRRTAPVATHETAEPEEARA